MSVIRCLVKIPEGESIKSATRVGFAVNIYCTEGYMWLSMPSEYGTQNMDNLINKSGFEKISEIEYL